MSRHDNSVRLRHMLDAARKARHFTVDKSVVDIRQDEILALALVRLLEIVGEAAARMSVDYRGSHPEIEWPKIVGLRDR